MAEGWGNVTEITGLDLPSMRVPKVRKAGAMGHNSIAGTEHILDFLGGDY